MSSGYDQDILRVLGVFFVAFLCFANIIRKAGGSKQHVMFHSDCDRMCVFILGRRCHPQFKHFVPSYHSVGVCDGF